MGRITQALPKYICAYPALVSTATLWNWSECPLTDEWLRKYAIYKKKNGVSFRPKKKGRRIESSRS